MDTNTFPITEALLVGAWCEAAVWGEYSLGKLYVVMPDRFFRNVHSGYWNDLVLDVHKVCLYWSNGTQDFDLTCHVDVGRSHVSSELENSNPHRWIVATGHLALSLHRLIELFIRRPAQEKKAPEIFVSELAEPISLVGAILYFTIVRSPLFSHEDSITDALIGVAHRYDRSLAVLGHMGQELGNRFGAHSHGDRHCRYDQRNNDLLIHSLMSVSSDSFSATSYCSMFLFVAGIHDDVGIAASIRWNTATYAISLATNSLVTLVTALRIWYDLVLLWNHPTDVRQDGHSKVISPEHQHLACSSSSSASN